MRIFGVIILIGMGYYFYAWYAETRDVERLCATYPEGASADKILDVARSYSGRLMGPVENKDKNGAYHFIYCSPITMCDVSCRIEVESGVVTESEFRSL